MTKRTSGVLLVAIVICAFCALFPPRRIQNTSSLQFDKREDGKLTSYAIPHAFLFSTEFGIYRGPNAWVFPAEVDGGRLLAQLVLIGSLTAVVILAPSLFAAKKA